LWGLRQASNNNLRSRSMKTGMRLAVLTKGIFLYAMSLVVARPCIYKLGSATTIFPTILYRLLKKVYQSFKVLSAVSSRSSHFGMQSSSFREDKPKARLGSFPVKTRVKSHQYRMVSCISESLQPPYYGCSCNVKLTYHDSSFLVHRLRSR
jgi:hypothetical protein